MRQRLEFGDGLEMNKLQKLKWESMWILGWGLDEGFYVLDGILKSLAESHRSWSKSWMETPEISRAESCQSYGQVRMEKTQQALQMFR